MLEEIEDALIELVSSEGRGWTANVRRLSTYGVWEYYIYTGPRVDLASLLAKLRARFREYRIEYEHRDDADWALYRK